MVIVACLEAVAIVAVVYLMLRHQDARDASYVVERRELISRITHPDRPVAVNPGIPFSFEPEEADELGLVGAIMDPPADEPS